MILAGDFLLRLFDHGARLRRLALLSESPHVALRIFDAHHNPPTDTSRFGWNSHGAKPCRLRPTKLSRIILDGESSAVSAEHMLRLVGFDLLAPTALGPQPLFLLVDWSSKRKGTDSLAFPP